MSYNHKKAVEDWKKKSLKEPLLANLWQFDYKINVMVMCHDL